MCWLSEDVLPLSVLINLYDETKGRGTSDSPFVFLPKLTHRHVYTHLTPKSIHSLLLIHTLK